MAVIQRTSTSSRSRRDTNERKLTAMVALFLLVLILALGVGAYLGATTDSRDPDYALGRILTPKKRSPGSDRTGNLPENASPRSSVDRAAAF
jgi:hypothetical protein